MSHKGTLGECRNGEKWDNLQKPKMNNLTLHTALHNNYYLSAHIKQGYVRLGVTKGNEKKQVVMASAVQ